MTHADIIQQQIEKKEREIKALDRKMLEAKAALQALKDVSKAAEQAETENQAAEGTIRGGSAVDQARQVLLKNKSAMHVSDILEAMGKEVTRDTKSSLNSSLAAYARKDEIFTRPGPSTYGLWVFVKEEIDQDFMERGDPPDDFGESPPSEAPDPNINWDADIPF